MFFLSSRYFWEKAVGIWAHQPDRKPHFSGRNLWGRPLFHPAQFWPGEEKFQWVDFLKSSSFRILVQSYFFCFRVQDSCDRVSSGTVPESGFRWGDFPKRLIRWYVFFIQPLFLGKSRWNLGASARPVTAFFRTELVGSAPLSPGPILAG